MDRRDFLRTLTVLGIPFVAPEVLVWAGDPDAPGAKLGRILVLVELKGGNDGLNTVVPYRDDDYRKARPRLALGGEQVVPLAGDLALHRSLTPLMECWSEGQLAIVQGVGYDNPNRSHFRSIEIWETASDANEFRPEGWLARILRDQDRSALAADGVVVGRSEQGPLLGPQMRNIVLEDPQRFTAQAKAIRPLPDHRTNPSLAHLLDVRKDLRRAAHAIEEKLAAAPGLGVEFPRNRFGRRLETAARLVASRVPLCIVKLSHGSFDTHSNQLRQHQRLLGELGGGLAAFRTAMVKAGLWDRVLVMTYSEFGRRVAENGSGGTDHGTAAPHLLLGERVKGGIHGHHPSLTELLPGGDLRHRVDYRSLYATVAHDWWGLPATALGKPYPPLGLIRKPRPEKL